MPNSDSVNNISVKTEAATMQFIGREDELVQLRRILSRDSASVMIYGKRKVGKNDVNHARVVGQS